MLQDAGSRESFGTSTSFLANLVYEDADDLLLCALLDRFLRHQRCLHALFCFFPQSVREDSSSELFSVWLDGLRGAAASLPSLKQPKLRKKSGRELPVVTERRPAVLTESTRGSNRKPYASGHTYASCFYRV